MINKNLPEDILYNGVTYPKGDTEIPEELEHFVDKLNASLNPQHVEEILIEEILTPEPNITTAEIRSPEEETPKTTRKAK